MYIKDEGCGLTHCELRTALTGELSKLEWTSRPLSTLDVLKYAFLRLADNCLVITKVNQQSNPPGPIGVHKLAKTEHVHIGLLSSKFI